jgi:hypothetical protein
MKKLVSILLLAISIQAMAQIRTPPRVNQELYRVKKNCPSLVTKKITSSASALIDSYKKLFENKANLCNSTNNILTCLSKMDSKYFSFTPPNLGNITFASFYEGTDLFRTIWGARAADFAYYGVCAPSPIVWPIAVASQNHVFAAKFVTIENFAKAPSPKNFLDLTGVPIKDILSIDCIKIEESNGYIAATDPTSYLSALSSRGILAYLTLTNNTQIICYIVNNYDNAGTLTWKE